MICVAKIWQGNKCMKLRDINNNNNTNVLCLNYMQDTLSNTLFIYLFIHSFIHLFSFGCVGSSVLHVGFLQLRRVGATLPCSARASHRGDFSCCGARALGARASVVAAHGLSSCGSQAQQLWLVGSVVVVHRLSCSTACGISLEHGSNPCPQHWQADS